MMLVKHVIYVAQHSLYDLMTYMYGFCPQKILVSSAKKQIEFFGTVVNIIDIQ